MLMRSKATLFCILLLSSLLSIASLQAQTPAARQAVFDDLSRRVGTTITLSSLTSWTWNFGSYTYVVGLGACPEAPATAPTTGNWQRYNIVYQGTIYEYIVSDNVQSVILCNQDNPPTAVPTAPALPTVAILPSITPVGVVTSPTAPPTATVIAPVGAACEMIPRLVIGQRGRVTPGDPNWVHESPVRSTPRIAEIPGGGIFTVVDGPVCDAASGLNYWLVRYESPDGQQITGYTAEGLAGEYWLEPVTGRPAILITNATTLNRLDIGQSLAEGHTDGFALMSVSPDSTKIATADSSGRIQLLAFSATGEAVITSFEHTGGVQTMTFYPNSWLLITGGIDGNIRVWDVAVTVGREMSVIPHGVVVSALALSPDGSILAAGSGDGRITLWNLAAPDSPVLLHILQPEGASVDELTFTPDGSLLIARSADGKSMQVWSIGS